jgi:hypothetical protein
MVECGGLWWDNTPLGHAGLWYVMVGYGEEWWAMVGCGRVKHILLLVACR